MPEVGRSPGSQGIPVLDQKDWGRPRAQGDFSARLLSPPARVPALDNMYFDRCSQSRPPEPLHTGYTGLKNYPGPERLGGTTAPDHFGGNHQGAGSDPVPQTQKCLTNILIKMPRPNTILIAQKNFYARATMVIPL